MQIGKVRIKTVSGDCYSFGVEFWTDNMHIGHKEVGFHFGKWALTFQWDFLVNEGRSEWLI